MIRVVVVDDHEVVRKGIIAYLQTDDAIDVVAQAGSGNEGDRRVMEIEHDVGMMDLIMDDGNGIHATSNVIEKMPDCIIIMLTSFFDDRQLCPAIDAGAFSYILNTPPADE